MPSVEPAPVAKPRRWRTAGLIFAVSVAGLVGVVAGAEISARSKSMAPRQIAPRVVVIPAAAPLAPDGGPPVAPEPQRPFEGEVEQVAGRETRTDAGAPRPERLEPFPLRSPVVLAAEPPLGVGAGVPAEGDAGIEPVRGTDDPDAGVAPAELGELEQAAAAVRVPCGEVTCPEGQQCCNASCGICTEPGEICDQRTCGVSYFQGNAACGHNTCALGQVCCNPTCGICAAPGASCDQRICMSPVETPISEPCGMNTCNVGQVCCNPTCGICARPGEPCSREICR
jgi:hypothetical protein